MGQKIGDKCVSQKERDKCEASMNYFRSIIAGGEENNMEDMTGEREERGGEEQVR